MNIFVSISPVACSQLPTVLVGKEGVAKPSLAQAYQLPIVHWDVTDAQKIITQGGAFQPKGLDFGISVGARLFSKDGCHDIAQVCAFL